LLFVERSNRTENLLDGLATRLIAPGRDPLAPAFVIVQGPGMERWLAQSIARRQGVCANTEFLFPRQFLERLFAGDPVSAPNVAWERERLVWSVAKRIDASRSDSDFAPLARHLEAVDGDWRLVQLAGEIATLFDRYITFRPDWIRDWLAAKDLPADPNERWQARLFRELTEELGPGHFADRALEFVTAAHAGGTAGQREAIERTFPDRIEIFAVSTLPPLYLSVIDGLALLRDVHLSVLSPSRSYWAELWREVADSDLESLANSSEEPGLFDTPAATPASRLLAGLGRLGGDFQRCLEDLSSAHEADDERYASPLEEAQGGATLLERMQADLLDLELSEVDGEPASGRVVAVDDDSIQIHLCHGPRRELEVVEAALRSAFEEDPTLTPEDVIVMAPRIDEIAPDIEAVFGVPHEDSSPIPHRIADRGALRRSPVAETFTTLLEILSGRLGRSEVIDWLAREPARSRFGLDEDAVERVSDWAARAGIRFGLDADHRAALDLTADPAHTWDDGLARLALAHATGASAEVFAGTAPTPLDPFADPETLGALGELESILSGARAKVSQPRTVGDWCAWLSGLLEATCDQSEQSAHEHASIRGWLQDLSERAEASGFERKIPFEAIRERVLEALSGSPPPQAFLAGGVTFCELVPLRAIPFRVIVLLGMSDSAFPRGRPAPGFDLIAKSPRAGDRDTRIDDRYLFLEALLSARDRLIVTVPGRDVRDGSDLPPSIVVTELLDAVDAAFQPGGEGTLREQLVVKHPLQSFSARYFRIDGDPRLRGRDGEAYQGARARRDALAAGGGTSRQFLDRIESPALGDPESGPRTLGLDDVIERVLRATRYFSRDRLRIRLPREDDVMPDLDPVALDPLEEFALGSALLDDLVEGADEEKALERLFARATLPAGLPGDLSVRGLRGEVLEVARIARGRCVEPRRQEVDDAVLLEVAELGTCQIVGRLDRLWQDARVSVGFGRIGRRSELEVWIRHLFLCVCVEQGRALPKRSVLVGRGEDRKALERVVTFEDVPDARAELARIFAWAWSAEQAPLPFFAKTSRKFASKVAKDRDQARRDAHQAYHGGESSRFSLPESEEELEHARIWEGLDPLGDVKTLPLDYGFEALAEDFFGPMLVARKTAFS